MSENTADQMQKLLQIMSDLRHPDTGCPWDIEQDFASIAAYTVEEAYEVTDAIERNDMHDLKDELGDLLFQVVYHAQMAQEQGAFDFSDVVAGISDKLIRRHPHVFADVKIDDKEQLAQRWEQHKKQERTDKDDKVGVLGGIASTMPALRWSHKIQKRAAATGFDWPDVEPVFAKLDEELTELKVEIAQDDASGENSAKILDEFGDVMFVCVNLGQHLQVDAEQALRHANHKFISRFTTMERLMADEGVNFEQLSLQQMEVYWDRSKQVLASDT